MSGLAKYPEPLVFGLDIGTRSIVGVVGYQDRARFVVLAMSVKFHETRSMVDGQIHDIAKVADDIKWVKNDLESKLGGRKLNDVCIAAAGRVLRTANVHADYSFDENTTINQEYIHSIDLLGVEKAHEVIRAELADEGVDTKYYCVGYTVVKYFLNGYEIQNLEGHKGTKIGADVLATFLPEEVVTSLYSAVEIAGLNVVNLTLEPIAAINVAIPENYRLLNIALVDVGAGTSDICITKDGSIIGYGMIPSAGDELTEALIKKFLVDFDTAEKLKSVSPKRKSISYKDIMGISHKVTPDEVLSTIESVKKEITAKIAEKIIELNGGTSVSAVFVVGGGGKLTGFTDGIATALKIPKERVALRGEEVMKNIEFTMEGVKKDSLYVTPCGICLSFFEQKNNFIYVNVSGDTVKLYDNERLTVFDALLQYGIPKEDIFPKRGADINFKINDKTRIVRGLAGEAAVLTLNGDVCGMNTKINANDRVDIVPSTAGEGAKLLLGSIPEYKGTITFTVNESTLTVPKFAIVNGEPQLESYEIQDGDDVSMQAFYTLEQLFTFMDQEPVKEVYINSKLANAKDKIYDRFVVEWVDENSKKISFSESKDDLVTEETDITNTVTSDEEEKTPVENTTIDDKPKNVSIVVNKTPVTLRNKSSYIFVDILDFYPFDISVMKGKRLVTKLNGEEVNFTVDIKNGDVAELYWE